MKLTKDLLAGGLFSVLGATALIASINYKIGTPAAMGPGFFPTLVAGSITVLGLALVAAAVAKSENLELPEQIHFKPLILITLSIVCFAILQDQFGLLAALAALVVVSAIAAGARRYMEILLIAIALITIAYLIFIAGLNIPFTLWAQ